LICAENPGVCSNGRASAARRNSRQRILDLARHVKHIAPANLANEEPPWTTGTLRMRCRTNEPAILLTGSSSWTEVTVLLHQAEMFVPVLDSTAPSWLIGRPALSTGWTVEDN
jgi:hypothetical protein